MRVLVADAETDNRALISEYCRNHGHFVEEALSGKQILDICRNKNPDLIFIDRRVTGIKPVDLIQQIRQLGGNLVWCPIILMAEEFINDEQERAVAAGVDDFFIKPISEINLLAKIKSTERQIHLKEEVYNVAHGLVMSSRAMESVLTKDALTGMASSNHFEEALDREWFKSKKEETTLALVMMNIDNFKEYNQTYGADAGDTCIKKLANTISSSMPKRNHVLARLSGDSFVILLPDTKKEECLDLAQVIQKKITDLNIPHSSAHSYDHVTLSMGISTTIRASQKSPRDLVEAADYALYRAKHGGRNRVVYVPAIETS